MKRIIAIALFLLFIFFIPGSVSAGEDITVCYLHHEGLMKVGLNDDELSEIRGQGFEVSFDIEPEIKEARIILWDETANRVVKVNLSTGYGNSQMNTLFATGR